MLDVNIEPVHKLAVPQTFEKGTEIMMQNFVRSECCFLAQGIRLKNIKKLKVTQNSKQISA